MSSNVFLFFDVRIHLFFRFEILLLGFIAHRTGLPFGPFADHNQRRHQDGSEPADFENEVEPISHDRIVTPSGDPLPSKGPNLLSHPNVSKHNT